MLNRLIVKKILKKLNYVSVVTRFCPDITVKEVKKTVCKNQIIFESHFQLEVGLCPPTIEATLQPFVNRLESRDCAFDFDFELRILFKLDLIES